MTVSTEINAKVFNDNSGDYVEIGPDPDALGLYQLTKVEKGGPSICMILEWEVAEAVADAIIMLRQHRGEGV